MEVIENKDVSMETANLFLEVLQTNVCFNIFQQLFGLIRIKFILCLRFSQYDGDKKLNEGSHFNSTYIFLTFSKRQSLALSTGLRD